MKPMIMKTMRKKMKNNPQHSKLNPESNKREYKLDKLK